MMFEAGNGMACIIWARLAYGFAASPVAAGAAGSGAGADVQAANNRDEASRAQALFIGSPQTRAASGNRVGATKAFRASRPHVHSSRCAVLRPPAEPEL